VSCCKNLRKPILARITVDALRFAWLRAPPSHRAKPDLGLSEVLTHKSPYEGGQSTCVPTIHNNGVDSWWARRKSAFATLRTQRFSKNISFAAINPPPAINTAAMTIFALGFAKPARIRNAVESSGVA
jgi:hypothetical protein